MRVEVRNSGPESTTPPDVELNPPRLVEVELPAGTQVVAGSISPSCTPAVVLPADPRRFNCLLGTVPPGSGLIVGFDMKITVSSSGGVGTASTRTFGPGTDLDTDPTNDQASFAITLVPGYDMMALGTRVEGKVGSTVPVTVGVKNLGPDTSDSSLGSGQSKHGLHVRLPAGTEMAQTEPPCSLLAGRVDPTGFVCTLFPLAPGESLLVTFHVRITARPTGTGTVIRAWDNILSHVPDRDTNRDNDGALITFAAAELPQTGTDTSTIAGIGAGTAAVGVVVLLVIRRLSKRREQRLRALSRPE
ncbi:LPXTG cell wall anchor domain-containing protein [Rhizocola hellebori]|nr:LPXTG cell wall anchor domain-containing protein [Rhizocola hellebori]